MIKITKSSDDIDEIFLHVKQLKEEQNSNIENIPAEKDLYNENLIIDNYINFDDIKPEDIFVILETRKITLNQFEGIKNQIITKMDQDFGVCDMCRAEVIFEKNLSGLVVFEKFFVCEKCSQNTSNEILNNWIQSKMAGLEDVKPIALWLMQKKNKKRLI